MKDVMLDIETLGTRPTSAMVQIGACYFDRESGKISKTFSVNIKAEIRSLLFTTDQHTIDWWEKQSQEAKDAVFTDDAVDIKIALEKLSKFLKDAKYMWSHATFDAPIVANAYAVLGMKLPIHYRNMRDIRTIMDLADHTSEAPRDGIHHNALDDCKFQVQYVCEAFKKLK